MKEKLKRILNCKWLWITAFSLVQIAFVSANIYIIREQNTAATYNQLRVKIPNNLLAIILVIIFEKQLFLQA